MKKINILFIINIQVGNVEFNFCLKNVSVYLCGLCKVFVIWNCKLNIYVLSFVLKILNFYKDLMYNIWFCSKCKIINVNILYLEVMNQKNKMIVYLN